jgi:hypothetical protein
MNSQVRCTFAGTDDCSVRAVPILDIFEGTQQIQQLIVARRLLGKTSAELKQQVRGLLAARGHGLEFVQ